MDRAYSGINVRAKAEEKGFITLVPTKKNFEKPWEYDKEKYKQRNEISCIENFLSVMSVSDFIPFVFSGFHRVQYHRLI